MFGHLKAEDFTNLLDGAALTDRLQTHLQSCAQCRKTFDSIQNVRNQIEEMRMESQEFIPEPDWQEFRSDVRNSLLSRSVQRENANRSLFGRLGWQPVMAWGVSMLLVIGLAGAIWTQQTGPHEITPQAPIVEYVAMEEVSLNSLELMSESDIFDDLIQLDADEALSLQLIIDGMAQEGVTQQ